MKRKGLSFLACVVLLSTYSCAGKINRAMESWRGHHYSNAIARMGPPTQVFSDGQGGHVLVWVHDRTYTVPGSVTTTTSTSTSGVIPGRNTRIYGTSQSTTTTRTRTV